MRALAQPSTSESRALQSDSDVVVVAHESPDQSAAFVLDHGDDRPLVDAEKSAVDPASSWYHVTVASQVGMGEARVE